MTDEKPKKEQASKAASSNPVVDDTNWRKKYSQKKRIKFDDTRKEIFLKKLLETGKKMLSCEYADIALCTVNEHLKNDPDFASQYDETLQLYRDSIVQRIEKEALEGSKLITKDKEGNVIREQKIYESNIRLAILKRNDDGYRDKQDLTINGGGNTGVLVVPQGVSMEEYLEKAKQYREKMLKDQAELAEQHKSE